MQDRIIKINEYFVAFNIAEGISYIKVRFPNKWEIPNGEVLLENFNVKIATETNGEIYFFSELINGTDVVFDAVDFVVDFNKDLEAKTLLFSEKINELKELFSTRTLSELQQLEIIIKSPIPFTIKEETTKDDKSKNKKGRRNNKKKEVENNEIPSSIDTSTIENNEEVVEPKLENGDDYKKGVSLLDYAQNLVEVNG